MPPFGQQITRHLHWLRFVVKSLPRGRSAEFGAFAMGPTCPIASPRPRRSPGSRVSRTPSSASSSASFWSSARSSASSGTSIGPCRRHARLPKGGASSSMSTRKGPTRRTRASSCMSPGRRARRRRFSIRILASRGRACASCARPRCINGRRRSTPRRARMSAAARPRRRPIRIPRPGRRTRSIWPDSSIPKTTATRRNRLANAISMRATPGSADSRSTRRSCSSSREARRCGSRTISPRR